MYITKEEAKELLLQHRRVGKGRFFSAVFVKKDKTYRRMLGRFGVRKYLRGTGSQWDESHQALQLWDAHKRQYRSVSTDTLFKLRIDGVDYDVI